MSTVLFMLAFVIGWFFLGYVTVLLINYLHKRDVWGFSACGMQVGEKEYVSVLTFGIYAFVAVMICISWRGIKRAIEGAWVHLKKYALTFGDKEKPKDVG